MSRDKQTEEMANVLKEHTKKNNIMASVVILDDYAEALYNAGYRKASAIIDEIVDFLFELEKIERLYAGEREALGIRYAIKKIREKYTKQE